MVSDRMEEKGNKESEEKTQTDTHTHTDSKSESERERLTEIKRNSKTDEWR
jgi:hypothetical protein